MTDSMEDLQAALNAVDCEDQTSPSLFKDSAAFARNCVTEDLHPAFGDSGIRYDSTYDCFAPEIEEIYDETTLLDSQKAFADALEQFQQGVKPKYQSKIDLRAQQSWNEVMECANEARREYEGVGRKGIVKKIDHRLKSFQTAAPAIEAWLKLLPSTSTYGSVVCGGLNIILEVLISGKVVQEAEADQEAGRYPTQAAPKGDPECLGPNASVHREGPTSDPDTWLFTAAPTRGNTVCWDPRCPPAHPGMVRTRGGL